MVGGGEVVKDLAEEALAVGGAVLAAEDLEVAVRVESGKNIS